MDTDIPRQAVLPVKTAWKFRGLFPWSTTPQEKSHPSKGEKPTTPPRHTEERGLGRGIHCRHSVVWGWFLGLFTVGRGHCPPGAWAPLVWQHQWHKGSAGVTAAPVAPAQSRTSDTGAWGTNTCRFPRQLLLGAVCQACLPWLGKHSQGLPKNSTGLPRAASAVPAHPVVKLQQRGCDSIQQLKTRDAECLMSQLPCSTITLGGLLLLQISSYYFSLSQIDRR